MTQDTKATIGKQIRQARKAKGMTQREAALHLEMSHVYLGKIERGECRVPPARARQFASAFGVTTALVIRQERATTMGEYYYDRPAKEWEADAPVVPDGEGWRMEGSGMHAGAFAWFWVRDVQEAVR